MYSLTLYRRLHQVASGPSSRHQEKHLVQESPLEDEPSVMYFIQYLA